MGLLSAIGGAIGLAVGGPVGAAIGSGIGSLAGGGDIKDALTAGLMGYGIGSMPGVAGALGGMAGAAGLQGTASNLAMQAANPNALGAAAQGVGSKIFGGGAGGAAAGAAAGAAGQGGGISSLLQFAESPLVLAGLMQAASPRNVELMTAEQRAQAATGERLPDYQGTAVPGSYAPTPSTPVPVPGLQRPRAFAQGGEIRGPGNGTSDSIPGTIYQGNKPVEDIAVSDGEFIMTNRAVKGAGNGDRNKGAARMYQMMREFEQRAS